MLLKANSFQKKIIPSLLTIPSELLPNFFLCLWSLLPKILAMLTASSTI